MSLYIRGIVLVASVTNIQWGCGVKKKKQKKIYNIKTTFKI